MLNQKQIIITYSFNIGIVLTHPDGTKENFVIVSTGMLVFLGGTGNVVHIINQL